MTIKKEFNKESPKNSESLDSAICEIDRLANSLEFTAKQGRDQAQIIQSGLDKLYRNLEKFEEHSSNVEKTVSKAVDESMGKISKEISLKFHEDFKCEKQKLTSLIYDAKDAVSEFNKKKQLKFYMIPAGFCLGVFLTSVSFYYLFSHKHDHHYHLSKDMAAEMRMGKYANMALDDMEEKEQQKFLKHMEKAAKKVWERR